MHVILIMTAKKAKVSANLFGFFHFHFVDVVRNIKASKFFASSKNGKTKFRMLLPSKIQLIVSFHFDSSGWTFISLSHRTLSFCFSLLFFPFFFLYVLTFPFNRSTFCLYAISSDFNSWLDYSNESWWKMCKQNEKRTK